MAKHSDSIHINETVRRLERRSNMSAWVILKDGKYAGRILQRNIDRCTMAVLDLSRPITGGENGNGTRWQVGWANGGGYDRATAALDGMTFDGHTFNDNGKEWHSQLLDWGFEVIRAI